MIYHLKKLKHLKISKKHPTEECTIPKTTTNVELTCIPDLFARVIIGNFSHLVAATIMEQNILTNTSK